jgi:hypothetical protein
MRFGKSVQQVWLQITGEPDQRLVVLPDELPQTHAAFPPAEQAVPAPIKEIRDYRNFFLRLPRSVRIIIYILAIIFIPIYIGLSFKFVRDVLDEHLENLEIRFHMHEPRHWFSAVEQKSDARFLQNWTHISGRSKPVPIADTKPAVSLQVPGLELFKVDALFDIYDFQAEMDIAYHGQESAAWVVRANNDATEMYLFVLHFSKTSPPLKLDAYRVAGQKAEELHVSIPSIQFKPLENNAVILIHLWADACVFPVSLQVENSNDPPVTTIAYAGVPCRQHGTVGIGTVNAPWAETFKRALLCSASESAKYSCGPDAATVLQEGSKIKE